MQANLLFLEAPVCFIHHAAPWSWTCFTAAIYDGCLKIFIYSQFLLSYELLQFFPLTPLTPSVFMYLTIVFS